MSGGLELDGVVRRGGFELALRVAVGPGEVVAVLGPNGAGKSTLLRTVAGLELLESGSLRVAGRVWQDGTVALPPRCSLAQVRSRLLKAGPPMRCRSACSAIAPRW